MAKMLKERDLKRDSSRSEKKCLIERYGPFLIRKGQKPTTGDEKSSGECFGSRYGGGIASMGLRFSRETQ